MRLISNWAAMRERYNRELRPPDAPELTQQGLAEAIGKAREEISRYETGTRIAGLLTMTMAAELLQCALVGNIGSDALYWLADDCDCPVTDSDLEREAS